MDALEILQGVELFAAAAAADLALLAQACSPRRLARGQVLFVEGEPSEHLYVVVEGRLKVLLSSTHGDDLVLAVLEPGDSLGELSVLDEHPRSASAEALEASTLLAVPADAVRELLLRSADSTLIWAQALAVTVRRLTGSTADLVFLDLPRRLAKLLVDRADSEQRVSLGMSQSEVAALLGVTRQSLNRALSGLTRRGWVQVDGSALVLRDRAALERFASS